MTTLVIDTEPLPVAAAAPVDSAERAVQTHLHTVWRYLRMHGARPDEAEDLAQECFVIAAERAALELDPAATAAFLHRTARFLLLQSRRKSKDARLLADAVDALWEEDCAADGGTGLVAALRRCLGKLAPRTARAVQLAYGLDGDEPARRQEIATELGLAENGVKTLMQRARQQLRDCLDRRTKDD